MVRPEAKEFQRGAFPASPIAERFESILDDLRWHI
jgi:hypothetical protein